MKRPFRKTGVIVGTSNGQDLEVPWEARATHLHIIGESGKGKSKEIESMIRQDTINDQGLGLLCPHGGLYNNLVRWLAGNPRLMENRRIHLIDPSADAYRIGFNPLAQRNDTDLSVIVDSCVNAFAQVWGGEDTAKTPQLKKYLRAIFFVLAYQNLTLLEAPNLSTASRQAVREYLTKNLPAGIFNEIWAEVNDMTRKEFTEQFMSTNNRLMEFLNNEAVISILGQNEHTIDFRTCMDEGDIVLVNLAESNRLSGDNARMIGALLVNHLFMLARTREPDVNRPFYLYIDECYEFLTDDIEKILVQTRKFGLHLVLVHHFLQQLRSRGDNIFHGVMNGAPTKIVFGLGYDDALQLVNRLFPEQLHPERPKPSMVRPVVVGQEKVLLRNRNRARGISTAESITYVPGTESVGETEDENGNILAVSGNVSEPTGPTESFGTVRQEGVSDGWSESFKSVFKNLSTELYSLDELRHLLAVSLMDQARREAVLKLPGESARQFITREVRNNYASPEWVEWARERIARANGYKSLEAIADEVNQREMTLITEVKRASAVPVVGKKGFREPSKRRIRRESSPAATDQTQDPELPMQANGKDTTGK